MTVTVAYCGLICPIYIATRQEKKEEKIGMRAQIVQACREKYGITYELNDFTDCDGCQAEEDRPFSACRGCPIRQCAREREVESCAHCLQYPCAKLKAFSRKEPAAKRRLDAIRKQR